MGRFTPFLLLFILPFVENRVVKNTQWRERNGEWQSEWDVFLTAPCNLQSWSVKLNFNTRAHWFRTWDMNGSDCPSKSSCIVHAGATKQNVAQGQEVTFRFHLKAANVPGSISAEWAPGTCGGGVDPQPPTGKPPVGGGGVYGDVLGKSILFYEAQRSGKLPSNNRISWRRDSFLNDGRDVGRDLTGGWFDAGDYVFFNFPMSSTVTMLAWGMERYKAAYKRAGQWGHALDCIKWPLDYFIKCHASDNELYGQVGDGNADHSKWRQPHDTHVRRPSFKITSSKPGSDLAGETAAAMAAGSIVFRDSDAGYADKLLDHAKRLYEFGNKHRGYYHHSITNAKDFYGSNGFLDELGLAAIWLHKATGEARYLNEAKAFLSKLGPTEWFSWDNKLMGLALLVYEMDKGNADARGKIEHFLNAWDGPQRKVPRTPKGLAFLDEWSPTRYAANAAFAFMVAADLGFNPDKSRAFAQGQIQYILGSGGRSFVVGYGNNPPLRPHHRSSSCPINGNCGFDWGLKGSHANPHVLVGSLVGGPDKWDNFQDSRNNVKQNEVATDYNAGFQSALAALLQWKS